MNVEFKFTPYTGDPKADHVETVAGTVRVALNGVPVAEQQVEAREVPVLFEAREIAPAVWLPVATLGTLVHHGENTVRFEFEPADKTTAYHAQLRWASVTDRTKTHDAPGSHRATNQADEGVDDRPATGSVVLERTFTAEFAQDIPWHHLPPVTSLSDEDRQRLIALVKERTTWLAPDFTPLYKALVDKPGVDLTRVRKLGCVEKAYQAGVRIVPPPENELDYVLTGGPAVVVRRKSGALFRPDPGALERIKGEEMQACAGMALAGAYPPRLVVVRTPRGAWEVVY